MKMPIPMLLVLLLSTGCISNMVVKERARPHTEWITTDKTDVRELPREVTVEGQPAYYALLPLTVVADIVASPLYLYLYIAFCITEDGP